MAPEGTRPSPCDPRKPRPFRASLGRGLTYPPDRIPLSNPFVVVPTGMAKVVISMFITPQYDAPEAIRSLSGVAKIPTRTA